MGKHELDWLVKCKQCKHMYQIQAEADEVGCRLKDCRFEQYEPSKKVIKQEMSESEAQNE